MEFRGCFLAGDDGCDGVNLSVGFLDVFVIAVSVRCISNVVHTDDIHIDVDYPVKIFFALL